MKISFKFLIILSFVFCLFTPNRNSYTSNNIFPENSLWLEDCLYCKSFGGITQSDFNLIVDTALKVYKTDADQNNEDLIINKRWTDPTVNADTMRRGQEVVINMYGGLARRSEINKEGFILVLCHELSHAYGGTPYITTYNKISAEGQADYMSSKVCAKKIIDLLSLTYSLEPTNFMKESCSNNNTCVTTLSGGLSLGSLLSVISNEPEPNYETPDTTVVSHTLLSYPDTIQCRLDTYFNGAVGKERPRCWFKN